MQSKIKVTALLTGRGNNTLSDKNIRDSECRKEGGSY